MDHETVPKQSENDEHGCTGECGGIFDSNGEVAQNEKPRIFIKIPEAYFGHIVRNKGLLKKIMEDTDTKIIVSDLQKELEITGVTDEAINKATKDIDAAVSEARFKRPFTHFLSIKITNPEIKKRFNELKTEILNTGFEGIDEELFQSEDKLHLTLGILSLADKAERDKAVQILEECKVEVIDPIIQKYGALSIQMTGLEHMKSDPSAVHVLYGKVHAGENEAHKGVLQILADNVVNFFNEKGFMKKEYQNVTLHLTLLNTIFRYYTNRSKKRPKRKPFDAREILKLFENFEFGTQELDRIHLSERSNKGPDGYYKSTSSVSCTIDL